MKPTLYKADSRMAEFPMYTGNSAIAVRKEEESFMAED